MESVKGASPSRIQRPVGRLALNKCHFLSKVDSKSVLIPNYYGNAKPMERRVRSGVKPLRMLSQTSFSNRSAQREQREPGALMICLELPDSQRKNCQLEKKMTSSSVVEMKETMSPRLEILSNYEF